MPDTNDIEPFDKRTKNGKPIDLKKVLSLKIEKGMTNVEIAAIVGYSKQYISKILSKFEPMLQHPEILHTYDGNRTHVLNSIELSLLDDLVDEDRRKKATLNNTAYAFSQIQNARRLESGQTTENVGVAVEVKLAKALERSRSQGGPEVTTDD